MNNAEVIVKEPALVLVLVQLEIVEAEGRFDEYRGLPYGEHQERSQNAEPERPRGLLARDGAQRSTPAGRGQQVALRVSRRIDAPIGEHQTSPAVRACPPSETTPRPNP